MAAYGSHFYRREGTYYFRLSIPVDVRELFGNSELRRSLHTGDRRVNEAEFEHLGLTHAQVGAYLLGLLGLPEPVVRAVAQHHESAPEHRGFRAGDAVYFANVLDHSLFVFNESYARLEPDPGRLTALGGEGRIEKWKRLVIGLGIDAPRV